MRRFFLRRERIAQRKASRLAEHKAGGGECVGPRAVAAHDRHAYQPALGRLPGLGVDDVVVAHAVFLKAALIDAGGHHEGVRRRQHAEKFRWVGRVLTATRQSLPSGFAPSSPTSPPRSMTALVTPNSARTVRTASPA